LVLTSPNTANGYAAVNRRALVTPSVSIKSDTCGADRRRDPTPKHIEPFLEPYNHALTSWSGELATLRRLTADNPDHQRDLDTLESTITQRLDELAQTIALKRAGQADAAVEIVRSGRGKLLMDRVRAVIAEMNAVEGRLLEERTTDWQGSVMWSTYATFGGAGVLLFAIMLIAWLASRDFRTGEAEAWLRRVQMALNTQVQGDLRVESRGEKILGVLVENLDAQVGAVYVTEPGERRRHRVAFDRAFDGTAPVSPQIGSCWGPSDGVDFDRNADKTRRTKLGPPLITVWLEVDWAR
jgi:CHASE3 domain